MTNPTLPTAGVAELLARVEAATGPDRELDARIYVELIARLKNPAIEQMIAERAASRPDESVWLAGARDWQVKPYTASLDAALALCERVLPTWRRTLIEHRPGAWEAVLGLNYSGRHDKGPHEVRCGTSSSPALALLAALLKAKANLSGAV